MTKNLLVVESPTKARTIGKMLGKDFSVMASKGHIRDLPEHEFGVDIERDFSPKYVVIDDHKKIVEALTAAAKEARTVYLAPDPDREGEAIAWHLREMLAPQTTAVFKRVSYHEITASAIRRALENPGEIDKSRVDAQQARRILDRLVGYKVSPVLRRRVTGAISAGRVQSVALRLICERERLIRNFNPEPFWTFAVKTAKNVPPKTSFIARLAKINGQKADVRNEQDAKRYDAELKCCSLRVDNILLKDIHKSPPPPFITSTLQQTASSQLGLYSKVTMSLAQRLYEGVNLGQGPVGLITYMRTDSFNVAAEAREKAAQVIAMRYGPEYVPGKPNIFKSRSSAQEAHEAIRPTDPSRTPDSLQSILDKDMWRLYDLIWRRFVASQMSKALIHQRTVEIAANPANSVSNPDSFVFRATTSDIVFPGFMEVLGRDHGKSDRHEEDLEEVASLPPLEQGESLIPLEWLFERKETQPPPRYSEASLIKTLEENGVGRPSTYAQIISVIIDRKYVDRSKKTLMPTGLGLRTNDFLVQHLDPLFNVKFTAEMESELDRVEEGKLSWTKMLSDFNAHFQEWIGGLRGPEADLEKVAAILDVFAPFKNWRPPQTRGKRIYSDEKFVKSIRGQYEKKNRPISQRQLESLGKLLLSYKDSIPEAVTLLASLGLSTEPSTTSVSPIPQERSLAKLALFQGVEFHPPRKVGKRVYDDAKFVESLREQVDAGRALTEAQDAALTKILFRYAESIDDFQTKIGALGISMETSAVPSADIEALFQAFVKISDWKPAVERKGRIWDDKVFVNSLREQYAARRNLSMRQIAALKRLAAAYKLI